MQAEFEELQEMADRRGFAVERSGAKFTILDRDGDAVWDRISFDTAKGFLKARPLRGEKATSVRRSLQSAASVRGFWWTSDGGGLHSIADRRDHSQYVLQGATPDELMNFLATKPILPAASARRVA
jgi:hypothetical protein